MDGLDIARLKSALQTQTSIVRFEKGMDRCALRFSRLSIIEAGLGLHQLTQSSRAIVSGRAANLDLVR